MFNLLCNCWTVENFTFKKAIREQESTCNVGGLGLIPGLGRSPEGGHGNPLHYSCLENPHGKRSLVGYSTWDSKELKMTKQITTAQWRLILSIFSQVFWLFVYLAWCSCSVTQLCPMLWDSVNPLTVAHQAPLSMGILHARVLEWVAMPSCRGASLPRDRTCVSCSSCIEGRVFATESLGS